jgi:hypothetical protein
MVWGEEQEKALKEIKRALTNVPVLSLSYVMKPFFLQVHERLGRAMGVLTQLLGSWHYLVAYLAKQLDVASQGLPPCLHACQPLPSWWLKQTNLLWDEDSV